MTKQTLIGKYSEYLFLGVHVSASSTYTPSIIHDQLRASAEYSKALPNPLRHKASMQTKGGIMFLVFRRWYMS